MRLRAVLSVALTTLWLTGCAGGAMLAEPAVFESDIHQARQVLSTHRLEPPRNLPNAEMQSTLDQVWESLTTPLIRVCRRIFSEGCWTSVNDMRVIVVERDDVNAYADASDFTIGVHAGFLRSAGTDDEVAAVLAHEAAHLLFGHAQKKASNAAGYGLIGGLAGAAIGVALHQPGMDPSYIKDLTDAGWNAAAEIGYLAYSPEMEIEADQFAIYVLKEANRRLSAGTDIIVRLHRGDVPYPVRQGDGWASYLATHPADDYRLAAIRSTLAEISQSGIGRPLFKGEYFGLGSDPRQRGCGDEFRRRWPECLDFQGQSSGTLNWMTKCPSDVPGDFPALWKICGAWYVQCLERPQAGGCYR